MRMKILESLTSEDALYDQESGRDKTNRLLGAIEIMNRVGLPVLQGPSDAPNPVIRKQQIRISGDEEAHAFRFFMKRPECNVGYVVGLMQDELRHKRDVRTGELKRKQITMAGFLQIFRKSRLDAESKTKSSG